MENEVVVQQQQTAIAPVSMADGVFGSVASFEFGQRMAKALASSDLVPAAYKGNMGSCIIALDMAGRMRMSPMTVIQNLFVIHGKPAWGSQFMISLVNTCGKYEPLKWEWRGEEGTDKWAARAWTTEKSSGEKVFGTWVSIGMAKAEGWYSRSGSKWQTMPELMLQYRSGAFFARMYAGHLLSGIQSADEIIDMGDAVVVDGINPRAQSPAPQADPESLEARATRKRRGRPPAVTASETPAETPETPAAAQNDQAGQTEQASQAGQSGEFE